MNYNLILTYDLLLIETNIICFVFANGRLKVLNISKLRGDQIKLRQTRRPQKTTHDNTGDNRQSSCRPSRDHPATV